MTIECYTPATGNVFFYIETEHGFMCSFSQAFSDVWFVRDLEDDEPIEGPSDEIIEAILKNIL